MPLLLGVGMYNDNLFHAGELQVQAAVGVTAAAQSLGRQVIHASVPVSLRPWILAQPMAWAGGHDGAGQMMLAPVVWPWGGIAVIGDDVLRFAASPTGMVLTTGMPLGLLFLDPIQRRRVRVNGVVSETTVDSFSLKIEQCYGNCPRYIAQRPLPALPLATADMVDEGAVLNDAAAQLVANADTFFIASAMSPTGAVDVSHRGGDAGFVRLRDRGTLEVDDFDGNNLFNTLGNLALWPHCALLFVDQASGDLLHLRCTGKLMFIDQDNAPQARYVEYTIDAVSWIQAPRA